MLASVGVAARDPFPSGGILTRPFVTHIFNLTVVIQVHTVGNTCFEEFSKTLKKNGYCHG
jgi:hypothetical protein